jgi:hypothetical protein
VVVGCRRPTRDLRQISAVGIRPMSDRSRHPASIERSGDAAASGAKSTERRAAAFGAWAELGRRADRALF